MNAEIEKIDLTPYIASREDTRQLVKRAFRQSFKITEADEIALEEWEKQYQLPEIDADTKEAGDSC